MGRRRNDDGIEPIARLAALVIIGSVFFPQVRQAITGLVFLFLIGAVIALVGFLVYRWLTAYQRMETLDSFAPSAGEHNPFTPVKTSTAPKDTAELLENIRSIDWFQFEKIVALVYQKQGYQVTRRGGANPDGGIDLVLEKDGLRFAVQCKQWKTRDVGVKPVREFLGALTDAGVLKGIFITLQGYTGDAKLLADKHGIQIVNETGLVEMFETTNAKADPEVISMLNDTRKFCPKCENQMILRTAKKAFGAGNRFWGCSSFPRCRFTMDC
jgi:restriction system protein